MKANLMLVAAAAAALLGACKGGGPGGPEIDACSGNPFTPVAAAEGEGTVDPAASAAQSGVLAYVNEFRLAAGALPVDLSPEIDVASSAHANYYVNNPTPYQMGLSPHEEDPAFPNGFTGVNFWDRLAAAGYPNSPSYEVMHFINNPTAAVDSWVNSVYHRSPFLNPATLDFGYGGASGAGGSADVIDFGCCASGPPMDTMILYPYHDQTGYPVQFDGAEGPPPPPPPTGWPSGSMISISFVPGASWSISAHEIYDDACTAVVHVASAGPDTLPGFDQGFLSDMFLMYPNYPLRRNATYTVNVEGTLGGTPFVRTWRFTTAP